jgi:negative regulator of sigma E activity
MKIFFIIGLTLLLYGSFGSAEADKTTILKSEVSKDSPDASELLKSSDRSRGAAASTQGLTWIADIISTENEETNEVQYKVKALADDALAEVMAPARQKGEVILFNDRTLWYFKPGLKKPVGLSARQKLSGQAANGDIASTQYSRDYEGERVGEEIILGQYCWKLNLKAKSKNTTYDKITYWISKKEKLAVRADFLTLSGEIFKSAEFKYGNTVTVKSATFAFISEMKIIDSSNSKNITVIKYQTPREESHAKMIFNVNNIVR